MNLRMDGGDVTSIDRIDGWTVRPSTVSLRHFLILICFLWLAAAGMDVSMLITSYRY